MTTYSPLPVSFVSGEGIWLTDTQQRRYLDAITGIAVCGLGHCHPRVTAALTQQASTLVHTSNLYRIPSQEQLGEKLAKLTGMHNAFFSNSGAEANEAAIKLARMYGHTRDIDAPAIIVTEGAFHGRTLATLTATGNRKVQAGFEPLVKGFVRAPFNDMEALQTIAANNHNVVAILIEPVQGEGGIQVPQDDYLRQVRSLCDQQGWLMMLDEIQTGNGRTGSYFHYQQHGILPDVVTTAKGLGNGMPIGACLASGAAAELFKPGNHGSTYGGNPLACATALAVVDTLVDENLTERARHLGDLMLAGFRQELAGADYIRDIRGKGLMIGIETQYPCTELTMLALEKGLLINVTAERVIRLLPALTMTDAEAQQIVDSLVALIRVWAADDRRAPR